MWRHTLRRVPSAAAAVMLGRLALAAEDPYSVLGVSRSATKDEIRKAYKSKAAASHPDRGGDAEEFKRVAQAYSILSDADKKATYDQGGHSAPAGGFEGGFNGHDDIMQAFRLFEDFFGQNPFQQQRRALVVGVVTRGRKRRHPQSEPGGLVRWRRTQGRRRERSGVRDVRRRRRPCRDLHSVRRSGRDRALFVAASPSSQVTERRFGGFAQRVQARCAACRGAGAVLIDICRACGGSGRVRRRDEIRVDVPKGAEAGDVFESALGVTVVIDEKPHDELQRLGSDLLVASRLSLIDALTGFRVDIPDLARSSRVAAGPSPDALPVKPDDVWVVRGMGMPTKHNPAKRGDLYVRFIVDFPDRLPRYGDGEPARRAALAQALGGDPQLPPDAGPTPSFSSSVADFFRSSSSHRPSPSTDAPQRIVRAPKSDVDALFRARRRSRRS